VPAIRDRTAETAAVLVLEPIFEADLQPEQYAYRQDRSALDAVRHVHKLINTGHGEIVDADLTAYFDSLPHAELLKSVARRVVDGAMLHLIKMWLEAPVEETDERGNKHRSTRNRDEGRGTPQGSPISPLLSNLYMRRFVLGWKKLGHERRLRAYIVNYADDLVICCRGKAEEALTTMRDMMMRLKLTVNETKTRVCKLPEEKFDFLGYTFGRCYSTRMGRTYLGTVPSKKRVQLDLPPKMRQPVKTQNPLNGGLSHGIVSQAVHQGVQAGRGTAAGRGHFDCGSGTGIGSQSQRVAPLAA
jgi:group II intron reverse transcriptase/maturase